MTVHPSGWEGLARELTHVLGDPQASRSRGEGT